MRRGDQGKAGQKGAGERLDNRVLPVMREAVALVQLVLFSRLKKKFAASFSRWPPEKARQHAGSVVNDLFASKVLDRESMQFADEHRDLVETELRALASTLPDLLPLLTDALRMQVMCDHQEGRNSLTTLLRARALGILQEERPLPLPSTFMLAVRRLGVEQGLLQPLQSEDPGGA
ncbi:MAG TPA: hypothetical protein DDY20_06330 [Desulfobulbaceae bacterium]|nr:hypothetical protein [Desulfobulbaceae bacterium]